MLLNQTLAEDGVSNTIRYLIDFAVAAVFTGFFFFLLRKDKKNKSKKGLK